MRTNLISTVFLSALFIPFHASAQPAAPIIYPNPDYGFQATFPAQPMMRDAAYRRADGSEVTAQQFYVERGSDEFVVTVVSLPDGPAVDFDVFDHAVEETRAKGEVKAETEVSYDPGIPGWQFSLAQADGRQRRVSIYMYDHRLFMAEAVTAPSDFDGMRFEQSLVLLNPDGSLVDTGSGNLPVERPE